jgi:hypothetical protein
MKCGKGSASMHLSKIPFGDAEAFNVIIEVSQGGAKRNF